MTPEELQQKIDITRQEDEQQHRYLVDHGQCQLRTERAFLFGFCTCLVLVIIGTAIMLKVLGVF